MKYFVKQDFSGRHSEQGPFKKPAKGYRNNNHIKNGQPEISG